MSFRSGCIGLLFVAALIFTQTGARADIAITNLTITTTSVSFDASGSFPASSPAAFDFGLALVNPDKFENPGYVIPSSTVLATSFSFPGGQAIIQVGTGVETYGDYFYIRFNNSFSPGENFNGHFSAQWAAAVFNPSAVSSLNVYWGSGSVGDITAGTFLASAPVNLPEPSSVALIGLTAFGFLLPRKRA